MTYASRDEIDERYRWDLSGIYTDDDAFEQALETASSLPQELAAFKGAISTSASQLLAYLELTTKAGVEISKLMTYAQRKSDEDTRVSKYQAYAAQVMELFTRIALSNAWFSCELLTLTDKDMKAFYESEKGLEAYRRVLDRELRLRPHVLSEPEETLLARASDLMIQPETIYSLFSDADLSFDDAIDSQGNSHKLTHGTYIPLMMNYDRTLRKSAFENMYASFSQFRNSCAAIFASQLKHLKFVSDARKYDSTLAASLDATEVPTSVYTNLIEAVHAHMEPMYEYLDLRKKILGVDELHFYDLYVPIVEDVEMKFTYKEACDMVLEALAPLGSSYVALVQKAFDERWIDVYESPGKRSGAYSAGGYGMGHPVMLLNFQGTLEDVFTLAHEMGHSIHTWLSCENQPAQYADYVIFVAEVASTVNEALLVQHLLKKAGDPKERDPKKRAYVLNHFLEQFKGTIYRQCMFAEFELDANELEASGKGVTADALDEMYRQLLEVYFGSGIVYDQEIASEWERIPHFYYQYYVYQYATGFSAAIALSRRILREGKPAVDDYLGFLSSGSSKKPLELLRGAGVDMSTTKPIDDALAWFAELVEEMKVAAQAA